MERAQRTRHLWIWIFLSIATVIGLSIALWNRTAPLIAEHDNTAQTSETHP